MQQIQLRIDVSSVVALPTPLEVALTVYLPGSRSPVLTADRDGSVPRRRIQPWLLRYAFSRDTRSTARPSITLPPA